MDIYNSTRDINSSKHGYIIALGISTVLNIDVIVFGISTVLNMDIIVLRISTILHMNDRKCKNEKDSMF